jgi:hypothetical protein
MSINWNNLRPWNGSQENSFEELCCQLAALEAVPAGSQFFRKGTPDAGVECFWRLPNTDEWALQAKFFRSALTSAQWQQVDKSAKTAIEKHPRLTKYIVCFPLDRADARIAKQTSFLTKWTQHVAKWQGLATKRGMSVTFEYWGQSEIATRLADEKQQGRHWFWFGEERFSNAWFRSRVDEAIANARDRYTPDLNVDLPIRDNLDGLGRTPKFFANLRRMYSHLCIKLKALRPVGEPLSLKEKYTHIARVAAKLCANIDPWVRLHQDYFELNVTRTIPWDDIGRLAWDVMEIIRDSVAELYDLQDQRKTQTKESTGPSNENLQSQIFYLREFQQAVSAINHYVGMSECKVSNCPALILVGNAGQGKTHLLCDFANSETVESRPRIIFHGEHFRNSEPWSQMISLLGLNCSREKFIGALEAAAQANNCRVLLLIDALNEGEGNRLWSQFLPGIITTLAQSQWLGICVSVRNSYEELIIPKSLDQMRVVRVEHRGFGVLTADAVAKFFNHFGIEPSTPMLLPEFENPLFLKLFCQSLYNDKLTRIPPGLHGITAIFRFFVNSIDKKLSRAEFLDYDPRSQIAFKAVDAISTEMAKRGIDRLPLTEAQTLVNKLLPRYGNQNTLYRHLEAEGVITAVPDYWTKKDGNWTEYTRFTYQRFADHLITAKLLDRHLDRHKPKNSFSRRQALGKLIKDERSCWTNRGILEALAIQIPEITKRELPEVAPHLAKLHPMREAFVESIIWRDPASFSAATDRYIKSEVLTYQSSFEDFWNSLIAIGTTPKHPLNAERLHNILSRFDLPNRDAWWSIFLHHEWGRGRAVDRLVSWALTNNDKSMIADDVIRLAGITLGWFFTSADRFLRDRATKAMVRLFEKHIHTFCQVLEKFLAVDDPYVSERLYAVGYGCAMRTMDKPALAELAGNVYKWVFAAGQPPPHVLLRDYARGTIELAVHRGIKLDVDLAKVRPPYVSEWPYFHVPALQLVEQWGEWKEDMPNEEWSRRHLYNSVMGTAIADFSHYVLGSFDKWSAERIDEPHKPTHEEVHDQFVNSLTKRQKEAWNSYTNICQIIDLQSRVPLESRKEVFQPGVTLDDLEPARRIAEQLLLRTFEKNSEKYKIFRGIVADYVREPHQYYMENHFDGQLARRWILQKIINMGWTVDRFGRFDRTVHQYRMHGREANKPERIGKTYQWIAYHELLARLSDNFKMREDKWSDRRAEYHGPWDIGFRRDIDPSNLTVKTHRENWTPHTNSWWFPTRFMFWDEEQTEVAWLKKNSNLPEATELIEVKHPDDGSHWFTLDGSYHWEQPTPLGEERYELKRRDLWYMLKCYLVKRADSAKLLGWAKRQNWMGRWMPQSHESHDIFLGEFFWSPAFKDQDSPYYGREGWTRDHDKKIPFPILISNDGYCWSGGSYDCSIDETICMALPCRFLVDSMHLSWGGVEGHWRDEAGQLVAFDPSVRSQGPSVLLFRKDVLLEFLERQGLNLFWTLLGEKRTIGGRMSQQDYHGHLEINGAYILKENTPYGKMRPRFVEPNRQAAILPKKQHGATRRP